MLGPEFDVPCRSAARLPKTQGIGDQFSGLKNVVGIDCINGHHFMRSKLPPPIYDRQKLFPDRLAHFLAVVSCGFTPQVRAMCKNTFHDIDEFMDAMVANRIFDRGEQTVICVESQNVPGVDDGSTVDPALQTGHDRRDGIKCLVEFTS